MEILTLSSDQQKTAKKLLEQVEAGNITHPMDIVDEWHPQPSWEEINSQCAVDIFTGYPRSTTEYKWVSLTDVIGIDAELIDRFIDKRFRKVLRWMLAGEFQLSPKDHVFHYPSYLEVGDEYYVYMDGTHRTLACKALDVDAIHAHVTVMPVV